MKNASKRDREGDILLGLNFEWTVNMKKPRLITNKGE